MRSVLTKISMLLLHGRFAELVKATTNDRDGVAAVEFSIVAPLLIAMLIGTIDYGTGFYRKMQVQNAAHAGAEYALLNGFDSSAITNAVLNATNFSGVSSSPAPVQFCGCPSMSGVTSTDCGSTCSSGSTPGTYVTISAQGSYETLFHYPMVPNSFNFTSQTTVRIK
jgi:Flp pilus assembly protein TadG